MAFDVKKIDPLDLQPRKAVGVSLPFSSDSVFTSTFTTKDGIRTNLINYFLTNKGERYLNPTFGSNIRSQLFNNTTQETVETIKEIIANDISVYFPRVQPTELSVTGNPETQQVNVYLKYQIKDSNIEDELLINIEQ